MKTYEHVAALQSQCNYLVTNCCVSSSVCFDSDITFCYDIQDGSDNKFLCFSLHKNADLFHFLLVLITFPVATPWVCGRLLARMAGSNSAEVTDVHLIQSTQ